LINTVEYTSHKLFGFIDVKNIATPNRDVDQANCIEKPFHSRLLMMLKVVAERFYCVKELYIHKHHNICQVSQIEGWDFVFSFNRLDITTPAVVHILARDVRN
jgi:hypothetical protein